MSLTLSRPHESGRHYPLGSRIPQHSPFRETEGDREKQRRRIAVACSRCRKRKIKCSGDVGDGRGCINCRNAGTDPSQCQFLRVQSHSCWDNPLQPDYPYYVGTVNSAPPTMLHTQGGPQPHPASYAGHALPSLNRPVRHSLAGVYSSSQASSLDTLEYPAPPEAFDSSTLPPASATAYIATQDNVGGQPASYGASDLGRPWTSGAGLSQLPAIQSLHHEVGHARYSASTGPYYHASGAHSTPESASVFVGMNSMASSLPASSMITERMLPNPRSHALPISAQLAHPIHRTHLSDPATLVTRAPTNWAPDRFIAMNSGLPSAAAFSSGHNLRINNSDIDAASAPAQHRIGALSSPAPPSPSLRPAVLPPVEYHPATTLPISSIEDNVLPADAYPLGVSAASCGYYMGGMSSDSGPSVSKRGSSSSLSDNSSLWSGQTHLQGVRHRQSSPQLALRSDTAC